MFHPLSAQTKNDFRKFMVVLGTTNTTFYRAKTDEFLSNILIKEDKIKLNY